jgi:putative restriction endonuclease
MVLPISITTTCNSPYSDSFTPEGLLNYKYRGTNPNHPDNVGLRDLMHKKIPLIYFHCIVPGKYLATWPVFIMGDDRYSLTFTVAVDDQAYLDKEIVDKAFDSDSDMHRRTYLTSMVKHRLHQRSFRERVLSAYHNQCKLCKLKHLELLDAAHIIP